jgi:aminoglycoside phosphotransferase (APT) family kinase protein
MHGDFASWNLRQLRTRSLVLVDWEHAGWGPPGADEVFYKATRAALGHSLADGYDTPEAIQFWQERVVVQRENARDDRLAHALHEILGKMAHL